MTVVMVAIFFVVSSMTFSGRLAEGKNHAINLITMTDIISQIMGQGLGDCSGGY